MMERPGLKFEFFRRRKNNAIIENNIGKGHKNTKAFQKAKDKTCEGIKELNEFEG